MVYFQDIFMRHLAALTLAAALLAAPASAATYTFSFDGSIDWPGTVSGLIEGLLDNGLDQSATSVFVTSVTGSAFDFSDIYRLNLAAPRAPNPAQYLSFSATQRFDVVNGAIALGEFIMFSQGLGRLDINPQQYDFVNYLCFFSASSTEKRCPGFLAVDVTSGHSEVNRLQTDGPGVTFARLPDQPSPVPLPAGGGLLVAALALMALASRPNLLARHRKVA
jgi:hypothetical protein